MPSDMEGDSPTGQRPAAGQRTGWFRSGPGVRVRTELRSTVRSKVSDFSYEYNSGIRSGHDERISLAHLSCM